MKLIRTSLFVAAAACAMAQQTIIDVVVKDRRNQPLKTVEAAQFEVEDGGVRVKDVSVRLIDGAEVVENGQRKPAEAARQRKLVMLVFEQMDNERRRQARQIARDLFKESKDPNHRFAVVAIANQLHLLQPFTSDRAALEKAVDTATSGVLNPALLEISAPWKSKLEAAAAGADPVEALLAKTQLAIVSNTAAIEDTQYVRRTLLFLNTITNALGQYPGRKAVAYLASWFVVPTFLDPPFLGLQARANQAGVAFYGIDSRGLNITAQAAAINAAVMASSSQPGTSVENTATVNLGGLENVYESVRNNPQAHLRVLSESTGGLLIADTNDPRPLMRQLLGDVDSYYEIRYDPKITNYDGAFRKTAVTVTAKDAKIRDRDGYFALPPELAADPNLLPFELPLMKALAASPLARDVSFRSGVLRLAQSKDRVRASVMVEVPLSAIQFEAKEAMALARLSMLVRVKAASGEIVEKYSRDLPLNAKAEQLEALRQSNFTFKEEFDVAPGRYVVEAAVADRLSGKLGARRTSFVAAGRAAGVGLSSIAMVRNYQPKVEGLRPEEPYQFQGGRIAPTLHATLRKAKGAQMALYFVVYADPAVNEPVMAMVRYLREGSVAGEAKLELPAPDAEGRIRYVLSSPIEQMPAGNYEVRITAQQGTAAASEATFVTIEEGGS
jgi:VWFA-related protein